MRSDSRTVRRRSGERPDGAFVVRLVRRFGGVSRILAMIRRTAASSSGVQAANDLCRSASASDAIRPSVACSSSCPAAGGSVAGTSSTAPASDVTCALRVSSSRTGSAPPRKYLRNTSSYTGMLSRLVTSVLRPAQYRSTRSEGSSKLAAELKLRMSPDPITSPAERSSREKPTSVLRIGGRYAARVAGSATGRDLCQVVAHELEVVAFLDHRAERVVRVRLVKIGRPKKVQGPDPVDGLGYPRRLGQVELAQPVDRRDHLASQRLGHPGLAYQHDLHLALGGRVPDPVVQAAPFQRVVQFAGAVGGEDDKRRALGTDRADLRDRDLEVGEQLEQEGLELVVGAVHLVDQQHRLVASPDRLEQRPLQQELGAEQLVDRRVVGDLMLRQRPDLQHLTGVVPFVERLVGVDALVALQPDQPAAQHVSKNLGNLSLADPDLALQQDRAVQVQRDEQRRRQPPVGEITPPAEGIGELADGLRTLHAALSSPSAQRSGSGWERDGGWGVGGSLANQRTSAEPSTRSRMLPVSSFSLPSRCSLFRHAARRSPSSSASPSNPTSAIFLQALVGPQSSSRSALVCPWALHTSRSTSLASSICGYLPAGAAVLASTLIPPR